MTTHTTPETVRTEQIAARRAAVNPMCANCAKWRNGCSGTHNQTWTGCIFRQV